MTDKVQKIREEVERRIALYSGLSEETVNPNRIDEDRQILSFIDSLQEEPVSTRDKLRALSDGKQHLGWLDDAREVEEELVSEELDKVAFVFAREDSCGIENPANFYYVVADKARIFKAGAKWHEEQFEKNRLKHCNSITNEQAEMEQGFIDQHLDKYQRMPTFLDAIEYGMNLQKEQMINKATKWLEENLAKETSAIVCGSANIDFEHAIEEFKKQWRTNI